VELDAAGEAVFSHAILKVQAAAAQRQCVQPLFICTCCIFKSDEDNN